MLVDAAVIAAVADALAEGARGVPIVVDPVLVSSSGTALLDAGAVTVLKHRLIARARIVTPNVPEAEHLAEMTIATLDDMRRAADRLLALGAGAVMVKGGHLAGPVLRDLVGDGGICFVLEAPRIATRSTHGTGCTLASAIAAGLAQGMALRPAVERAHAYVQRTIATAPGLGRGHGPLNHAADGGWGVDS
jgi:hydroxymethylpyrimidine/phosphomethylpyrimidine kinase